MSSLFIFKFLFIFFIHFSILEAEQFNRGFRKCVTKDDQEGECRLDGLCIGQSLLDKTYCMGSTLLPRVCCPHKPEKQTCGRRSTAQAIVGGQEAQLHHYPWQGALYKLFRKSYYFICGCSLVNERFVLTAAHCVSGFSGVGSPESFRVKLGAHHLKSSGMFYEVKHVLAHSLYSPLTIRNDIALIRLKSVVTFSSSISPVCLPSPVLKNIEDGTDVTVSGWGSLQFQGPTSPTLQEVTVKTVNLEDCSKNYSRIRGIFSRLPRGFDKSLLCAGVPEGGKDSCQGDSGGPLVYTENGTFFTQLGIVSFGYKCASPGYPGVYTRITSFLDWIYTNMRQHWY